MEKQKLECQFCDVKFSQDHIYTCWINKKDILINTKLEFIGKHKTGKTIQDVKGIYFDNCTVPKLPQELTKIFPNLNHLQIYNSKMKSIERQDLKQFVGLRYIFCGSNEIEFLPGDLFADQKNLEFIGFGSNKITMIQPNILNGLEKLKYVDFSKNPLINKFWDSIYKSGNVKTLQEIKDEIQKNIATSSSSSKKMPNEKVQLKQEMENLQNICSACMNENGLYNDLKKIIQNEKLKDFIVTVNDEDFKVHKFLLAARSPVLKEMIENNIDADSLNLIDISKEIFREILNFINYDELPYFDDINFIHLYAASERLKIENLKKFAAEKLMDKINDENAMEVLTLANKYNNEDLKRKSFEKIKDQLGDDTAELSENLASNPEQIKRILAAKKKKDEMMKQMSLELAKILKE